MEVYIKLFMENNSHYLIAFDELDALDEFVRSDHRWGTFKLHCGDVVTIRRDTITDYLVSTAEGRKANDKAAILSQMKFDAMVEELNPSKPEWR